MKRIYLIDCPGVVYPVGDTESEIVLKGVVSDNSDSSDTSKNSDNSDVIVATVMLCVQLTSYEAVLTSSAKYLLILSCPISWHCSRSFDFCICMKIIM